MHRSSRIRTLLLHGLGKPPDTRQVNLDLWFPEERFHALLDMVQQREDIRLTFDDGNISDLETALPELLRRGLKAVFFICVGLLDRPGFIGAGDLRRLVDNGMIIGTHGMHHRRWRSLSGADLDEEIVEARHRLEDMIGRPITKASIPGGFYDRRLLSTLRKAGYAGVYTSDGGTSHPESWLQPRISIRRHHDQNTLLRVLTRKETLPARILHQAKRKRKEWR